MQFNEFDKCVYLHIYRPRQDVGFSRHLHTVPLGLSVDKPLTPPQPVPKFHINGVKNIYSLVHLILLLNACISCSLILVSHWLLCLTEKHLVVWICHLVYLLMDIWVVYGFFTLVSKTPINTFFLCIYIVFFLGEFLAMGLLGYGKFNLIVKE